MPSLAMWCGAIAIDSRPLMVMEPVRLPTSPTMDLMVVVRPAPLRPSKVTTSPLCTVRSTPCRMCDSPYQAWRLLMRRNSVGSAMGTLQRVVGRAHIGFEHLGVLRYHAVRSFGNHLATLQHADGVGNAGNHIHVVLDHQDGAVGAHLLDELRHAVHVLVAHALRGFVQHRMAFI